MQVERIPELPHEQSQTVEIANVQVGKFKYKYANANTQILTCNHMQVEKSATKVCFYKNIFLPNAELS